MQGKSSHVEFCILDTRLDLFLWWHSDISATFTKSTNGLSYINKLLFSLKLGYVASPCKLNTNKASVRVCAAGVFHVCPAHCAACTYSTSFQHHLSLSHHVLKLPFDLEQEIWLPQSPAYSLKLIARHSLSSAVNHKPSAPLASEEFATPVQQWPHPHKSSSSL